MNASSAYCHKANLHSHVSPAPSTYRNKSAAHMDCKEHRQLHSLLVCLKVPFPIAASESQRSALTRFTGTQCTSTTFEDKQAILTQKVHQRTLRSFTCRWKQLLSFERWERLPTAAAHERYTYIVHSEQRSTHIQSYASTTTKAVVVARISLGSQKQ